MQIQISQYAHVSVISGNVARFSNPFFITFTHLGPHLSANAFFEYDFVFSRIFVCTGKVLFLGVDILHKRIQRWTRIIFF